MISVMKREKSPRWGGRFIEPCSFEWLFRARLFRLSGNYLFCFNRAIVVSQFGARRHYASFRRARRLYHRRIGALTATGNKIIGVKTAIANSSKILSASAKK